MDRSSTGESIEQTDQYPLLMEQMESHCDQEHIIDLTRHVVPSSSSSQHDEQPSGVNLTLSGDISSSSTLAPTSSSSSSNRLNSRNSSFTRRTDGYGRHRRSPLNSGLWISVELVVTVSQIIASIVVLSLSQNEKPQAPLFEWIVGYASGCFATLPILCWRFRNRNRGVERDSSHLRQGSAHGNVSDSTTYAAISVTTASNQENGRITEPAARNSQMAGTLSTRCRLNGLVDHLKMALDFFFAVWFVVGNVWIFGGHSSPSDAPKLYRLCIVLLTSWGEWFGALLP